jgi:hypothetical protein
MDFRNMLTLVEHV